MSANPEIEALYQLVSRDQYKEAVQLICQLRGKGKKFPELSFYEAICCYEEGMDLECLKLLAEFLRRAPKHPKRNYAVFTTAICLINLGLPDKSLQLLKKIPSTYPDRDSEIENLKTCLNTQAKALKYAGVFEEILGND